MDTLKNCPFCGGEATSCTKQKTHELLKEHGHEVTIFCKDCGVKIVKWCDMKGLAYGAAEGTWNNRKTVDDVLKRLEEEYKAAADDMKRCSWENPLQFDSAKGYARGMSDAIEIIKEKLM